MGPCFGTLACSRIQAKLITSPALQLPLSSIMQGDAISSGRLCSCRAYPSKGLGRTWWYLIFSKAVPRQTTCAALAKLASYQG